MKRFFTLLISIVVISSSKGSKAQNFSKLTQGPAVSTPSDSRCVNWVDINNDGLLDLMITNGLNTGQNNFMYLNKGNDVFEPINSTDPIVNDLSPSDGATWGDIDNDGDLDCFVVTWYNKKNLLYLNNGDGSFKQVKTGSIATELSYAETASWGDYDDDGKLDLYISISEGNRKNILYKGNGDSTFTKKINATTADAFKSRSVNWIDYDNDSDLDLFVSNEGPEKVNLYRNDSNGVFTKITTGILANTKGDIMSSSWADVDNDGDFDVFLSNYNGPNRILINLGAGDFRTDTLSTDTIPNAFGSSFGDVDNDGDLDLYVSNAFGGGKLKNVLYLNNGAGKFTQNNATILTIDSGWTYGCAFGDYNNDGFLDLANANCFDKTQVNSIFKNIPNGNAWFELNCIGTISNKSAIGAKVKLSTTINNKRITQLRDISAQSGHNGQNMMRVHFGLGNATNIDTLEIEWPSGKKEIYQNLNVNQIQTARENIGLGINKQEKKSRIKLYPNPSDAVLYVQAEDLTANSFLIFDLMGRIVQEGQQQENKIDISTLQNGIYFLKIEQHILKFIKN